MYAFQPGAIRREITLFNSSLGPEGMRKCGRHFAFRFSFFDLINGLLKIYFDSRNNFVAISIITRRS